MTLVPEVSKRNYSSKVNVNILAIVFNFDIFKVAIKSMKIKLEQQISLHAILCAVI